MAEEDAIKNLETQIKQLNHSLARYRVMLNQKTMDVQKINDENKYLRRQLESLQEKIKKILHAARNARGG